MAFTSSLSFKETLTQDASGSIVLYGSGSTGRTNVFAIDGGNGRLFSVDDSLSDSLFSVNTIAGLPVIEAFADNTVNIGKYGAYSFVATGSGDARIGSGSVMFVSASGNVGIGTTNPGYKLEVVGDIRLQGNNQVYFDTTGASASNYIGITNDYWLTLYCDRGNNSRIDLTNGSGILFSEQGTERMRINAGGNVGIGTTNPSKKLHIKGGDDDVLFLDNGGQQYTTLYFANNGTTKAFLAWDNTNSVYTIGSAVSSYFNFLTGNTERMRITSAGDVGIGTTSPAYKLQVVGAGNASGVVAGFAGTGPSGSITISHSGNGGSIGYANVGATNNLFYVTTGAGTIGSGITMDNNGNVGIGTTGGFNSISGTETTLHIVNSNAASLYLNATSGKKWALYGASLGFNIYNATDGITPLVITNAGNVGISTTSPGYKLDVQSGSVNFRYDQPSATSYTYFRNWATGGSVALLLGTNDSDDSSAEIILSNNTLYLQAYGDPGSSIQFGTRNSSTSAVRMMIDQDGKVGIGTTSPSSKFHVKGDATDNVGLALFQNDYASGDVYFPAASFINTRANHSFGIVAEFRSNTAGDTDRPSILFYGQQVAASWQVGQVTSGWGSNDSFGIGYRASNTPATFTTWPTNYLSITTAGNVGIGTTNPGSKLTVIDSNNTTPLTIGAGSNAIFEFKGNSTSGYTTTFNINDTALYIGHNSSGRNLVLQTNTTDRLTIAGTGAVRFNSYGAGSITGTATYNLAVDSSGNIIEVAAGGGGSISGTTNYIPKFTSSTAIGDSIIYQSGSGAIGIGTSAPTSSISTTTEKSLTIKGSSYGSLYLQAGSNNFRWWASTSTLLLTDVVTSTDIIIIDNTNNYVGIKNSSAAHALDVNGSIRASSNAYVNGSVYIGTDGVYLYAEDVASSSELKVIDEAGNITTLSPHNFSLIPEGPSEDLAWSYYSENKGKKINVDMLKLARILEKLTGEKLVYIEE